MTSPLDRLAEALKDRYTLERELGAGGMATVYLAHDLKHHRKVALKLLHPELALERVAVLERLGKARRRCRQVPTFAFSSSKKFSTTMSWLESSACEFWIMMNPRSSGVTS